MSISSSSSPHQLTPKHPPKRARVTALPSASSKSSQAPLSPHSAATDTDSDTASWIQGGCDIRKLLKAVAAFRLRNGISPTMSRCFSYFFKEVKELIPKGLSEKQLYHKLCHLRLKFQNDPIPGPNCPEFDRSLYDLGVKAWGSRRVRDKRNSGGSVKRNGKADGLKNERKGDEESENEEDEDTDSQAGKSMKLGNYRKNELLEDDYVNLLDEDEAGSPYKYLKHALEEFWTAKNLDLNVLQLALQKVDSAKAKRLDEQFMEIAKDELKLKIEKNRLSNDIIHNVCSSLQRW